MNLKSATFSSPAVLVLALALALAPSAAMAEKAAAPGPLDGFLSSVKETTLPNGLTLLVREQPGTGVVVMNTWVKAGYSNESDEVAGMAHLFEHMFFKGSRKFLGAEQISQELAAVGDRDGPRGAAARWFGSERFATAILRGRPAPAGTP